MESSGSAAMNVEYDTHDSDGRLTLYGLAKEFKRVLGLTSLSIDETIQFIRKLDNQATPGRYYFYSMLRRIQGQPYSISGNAEIGSGTYGSVIEFTANNGSSRVVKKQQIVGPAITASNREINCRDFFVESLIQILLCNDMHYGKHIPKIFTIF